MADNMSESVILFDGVCNLCNSFVNYIIDHDPHGHFKLGTLQSNKGNEYLEKFGLDIWEAQTIILIENDKAYTRSTAALRIARRLKGPLKITWIFILVPPFIRDTLYEYIAKNRYKWFGSRNQCRVPTPELMDRFI